ncbi:MAG: hypothetical protein Q4A52_03795 [Bacillota bacterium]|nr:hypothetical protein [Bacillota bacterium]
MDNRIDEIYNDLCAFAAGMEHRKILDEALAELQNAGIEDGDGLFDYMLFEKGLIDHFSPAAEDREMFAWIRDSKLSVFEAVEEGIRDLLTGATHPIRVAGADLLSGRLVGGVHLLEERRLDGLRPEMLKATLENSPNPMLDILKFQRAVHFNIPDETMLYQAVYAVLRDPVEVFTELGYDVFEEETMWFSLFLEDEFLAEFEVKGNLLYLYCNNPLSLERITTHLNEKDLRFVRKEVLSAEELILSEDS